MNILSLNYVLPSLLRIKANLFVLAINTNHKGKKKRNPGDLEGQRKTRIVDGDVLVK